MFGFGKRRERDGAEKPPQGPRVSTKLCIAKFNGKYPHVGLYDCRERKVWICKPLNGQAIRTSHARLSRCTQSDYRLATRQADHADLVLGLLSVGWRRKGQEGEREEQLEASPLEEPAGRDDAALFSRAGVSTKQNAGCEHSGHGPRRVVLRQSVNLKLTFC
jgi:hypothetical protein